eukprot:TRINITY_DN18360_c1_g1_i1.p1 TRINITY_DN18360_c1_g1~~TRINITY_DN18360_c1_g1_i1.p1  ORF type:complete len:283 (+),score=71.13 TRINITY_DN18360_c1_g1_i1:94-942(+)
MTIQHGHGVRRAGASVVAIAIAAGVAILSSNSRFSQVFVGSSAQGAERGHATQLRARLFKPAPWIRGPTGSSPYYSNQDRERLARQRKEARIERRKKPYKVNDLNFDKLPPINDIYSRKYSGNVEQDGPGGRKRYTMTIMYKYNPQKALTAGTLKTKLDDLKIFMRTKMSCRDLVFHLGKSDTIKGTYQQRVTPNFKSDKLGRESIIALEYPMKQYGEVPRGLQTKPQFDKAVMVDIDFFAPVGALEYIKKRLYADDDVLRLQVLGHTRTFKHLGEDNELFL